LVGVSRRVIRYQPIRADDAPLRARSRELAAERRRFGYRRLGYLLAREGITPNHEKRRRIYREEKLRVRRRGGRKRALGTRARMLLPDGPNLRWSLDFVCGTLTCSRRFRILRLVDDYTRECLALVADTSLSGVRVARELTRLIGLRGKPHAVVSDSVLCREARRVFASRYQCADNHRRGMHSEPDGSHRQRDRSLP
jgi:putative transposase